MSLVEFNWNPTDRQLRQFAVISVFALPIVGWLWSAPAHLVAVLALVGLFVATMGWIQPRSIKPVFVAMGIVATPIGMIVGELMMLLIYGLVFLPMGFCFRVMGRDALKRRRESRDSYWEPVQQPRSVASYYRQS